MEPSSAPWRVLETTEEELAPQDRGSVPRGLPWPAIVAALVAVAVAVAAFLVTARPESVVGVDGAAGLDAGSDGQGGTWPTDPASDAMGALSATRAVVVDVGGAVLRPGVYRLRAGSRVADAVEAAGGYGASVDAARVDSELNLAAAVRDGEKIRVPVRGETASTAPGSGGGQDAGGTGAKGGATGGLVDLNGASAEALDALPGVGPATAAKIIAAREERPFATIDELLSRKVVGSATLEKLRPLVRVGP